MEDLDALGGGARHGGFARGLRRGEDRREVGEALAKQGGRQPGEVSKKRTTRETSSPAGA